MISHTARAARIDLSFGVMFTSDRKPVAGRGLNLSESGLLADFEEPLELWSTGELAIDGIDEPSRVPAFVARVDEHQAGLAFRFTSDKQREAIRTLVAYAEKRTHLHTSRPPF